MQLHPPALYVSSCTCNSTVYVPLKGCFYILVYGDGWMYHSTARLSVSILLFQQDVFHRLYLIYTVGYSISLGSLMVAVVILGYFR